MNDSREPLNGIQDFRTQRFSTSMKVFKIGPSLYELSINGTYIILNKIARGLSWNMLPNPGHGSVTRQVEQRQLLSDKI